MINISQLLLSKLRGLNLFSLPNISFVRVQNNNNKKTIQKQNKQKKTFPEINSY